MKVKYLILGAGPAGLTFANRLKQMGEDSFLVLEKECTAGGLCRSKEVEGSPLDIGGGHFLDVRREKVNEFLFSFMPREEWNRYKRDSRIQIGDMCIGHPFEAHIWQMPQEQQVAYLKSIAIAGCNLGQEKPEKFVDWIIWKLGQKIADEYMLPYNRKMFGEDLNALGTYWLNKLPDVSFEDTLLSCLNRKMYGTQPGHAEFYYPKHAGYGELWKRMAEELGERIEYQKSVKNLDVKTDSVTCVDGSVYTAENIITTIPWNSVEEYQGTDPGMVTLIRSLKHSGVEISYVPEQLDTKAHWIYIPDEKISYHRILVRHNFCDGSKGYWTETNLTRCSQGKALEGFFYDNEYAYPLNTIDKPENMEKLLGYMKEHGIYGLGRWGEHQHYNSDVVVEKAMQLAEQLMG